MAALSQLDTEIKKAQQADEFAQMMIERCSRANASKDKRASKFMPPLVVFGREANVRCDDGDLSAHNGKNEKGN